jgi:hypothetical protein
MARNNRRQQGYAQFSWTPTKPTARLGSKVQIRDTVWLWRYFVACQFITMIYGKKNIGKTSVALSMAAAFSNGLDPYGVQLERPLKVLVLSMESIEGIVKPRLEKLGADMNHIVFLEEYTTEIDCGMPGFYLGDICRDYEVDVIIVDGITNFVGDRNENDNQDVKDLFADLRSWLDKFERPIAFVMVASLNKDGKEMDTLNRVFGSSEWTRNPDAIFALEEHDDAAYKMQCRGTRIGPMAKTQGYTIDDGVFRWQGDIVDDEKTDDDQAPRPEENPVVQHRRVDRARDFFYEIFAKQERWKSSEATALAKKRKISRDALFEFKATEEGRNLIMSQEVDGVWYWYKNPLLAPPNGIRIDESPDFGSDD